jgi:3-oxoacyl-[acyl-carrier protein] reductase
MVKKLKGKVVIITGGADDIGKLAAEKFSMQGARVIIWDGNEKSGKEAVKELKNKELFIDFMNVDITKPDEVANAAKLVFEKFGNIHILVNNAGVTRDSILLKMSQEQWQQVIDINLSGVLNCTKAIAPYMVQRKYGRIINTSSMGGLFGILGQTNYSATKSGVVGITKVWARELSKSGITVNAVIPGFIETANLRNIPKEIIKSIKEKIPVGRLGSPSDIAHAYLFLASEEASYISGSVLNVDGCYSA